MKGDLKMKRCTFLRGFSMLLVALLMLGGTVSCSKNNEAGVPTDTESDSAAGSVTNEKEKDDGEEDGDLPERSIDLYLIAGQSNATGFSIISDREGAYEWSPELKNGFTHIHYAGNSRSNGSGDRDRDIDWRNVTFDLGAKTGLFGPEAGMAKAMSEYYNEESGRDAGFIKYAYGGSSLLNRTDGSTHCDGNWVSPSYKATLTYGVVEGVTGKLYENFLEQVERNISQLKQYGGYTTVNIRGLYWMQGCSNKTDPVEYEKAFAYFAADIRRDLSAILKEYTGTDDDCGASEMPIVVGTISQTQNLLSENTENINIEFIEMQKGLADKIENCYVADNSAYAITRWENGKAVILGSDQWHWNQEDALAIGVNVGNIFLSLLPEEE